MMPNPGKPKPPADPRKQRTPNRNTQSPVVIGNPDYRDIEPVDPAPRFTSILAERLRQRRKAERKAKETP